MAVEEQPQLHEPLVDERERRGAARAAATRGRPDDAPGSRRSRTARASSERWLMGIAIAIADCDSRMRAPRLSAVVMMVAGADSAAAEHRARRSLARSASVTAADCRTGTAEEAAERAGVFARRRSHRRRTGRAACGTADGGDPTNAPRNVRILARGEGGGDRSRRCRSFRTARRRSSFFGKKRTRFGCRTSKSGIRSTNFNAAETAKRCRLQSARTTLNPPKAAGAALSG